MNNSHTHGADDLLRVYAEAVIGAHEHGETGGYYVALNVAETELRKAIAAQECDRAILLDTIRDLGNALLKAREMVGHPDNVAFINRAIALAGIGPSRAAGAPQVTVHANLRDDGTDQTDALQRAVDIGAAFAAGAPAETPKPEDLGIKETGDRQCDTGTFLLTAAQEFWNACHQSGQYGAVQWITGANGELLIYTRGEYREQLMENIYKFGDQSIRNFATQAAPVQPATIETPKPVETWTAGNLLTLSDSTYPGMGKYFGQVWHGDSLIARVYGDSREEVQERVTRVIAVQPATGADGQDAKDAARYRWLRDTKAYVAVQPHYQQLPAERRTDWAIRLVHGNDDNMDAAIDAAMLAPANSEKPL